MSVKSVYNFVPAPNEDQVFTPDWADQVNHDVPFSDGESGEIELTITAETPIFIRNGHTEGKDDNRFSHITKDGKPHYFIPATSIKGMLRNVLEILSFSRMKQVNDHLYAFRDLTRNSLYLDTYKSNDVKCGWLSEDEQGNWIIEDCGEPIKITHKEIDDILGTDFYETYKAEKYVNAQNVSFEKGHITFKHNGKQYRVDKNKFSERRGTISKKVDSKNKNAFFKYLKVEKFTSKRINRISKDGKIGQLVFTGQSSLRNHERGFGKNNEFIFSNEVLSRREVSDTQKKNFKFIYLDHDKNNISKDWDYWRKKLDNKEKIPVFFNRNSTNGVNHFGLAYMYKLPYDRSIHKAFPYHDYNLQERDISEIIFGYADKHNKLKGRVMISHAFSDNAYALEERKEILASPKASYFPFYLNQLREDGDYNTYQDKATLRGYKKYVLQEHIKRGAYDPKQLRNNKIFTSFQPLDKGAIFRCKIRFHNLRAAEIGALLSAITLHQTGAKAYHSLGGIKPYGYGRVRVKINETSKLVNSKEQYLSAFEKLMGVENWLGSNSLKELAALSQVTHILAEYPKDPKEFVAYKNERPKLFLEPFSEKVEPQHITRFNSISILMENKEKLATGDYTINKNSLKDIKASIKELGKNNIPKDQHDRWIEAIKYAFDNDRPTRSKLTKKPFDKEYEWHTTLTNLLGRETAENLYKELKESIKK